MKEDDFCSGIFMRTRLETVDLPDALPSFDMEDGLPPPPPDPSYADLPPPPDF